MSRIPLRCIRATIFVMSQPPHVIPAQAGIQLLTSRTYPHHPGIQPPHVPPAHALTTPRLLLEPLTPAHAEALFAGLSDPALYTFIPQEPPVSLDALRERFLRIQRGPQDDSTTRWLNWAVRETETREYSGVIETTVTPGDSAYLAYFIFTPAQRRGLAREACGAVMRHLAAAHGVQRFVAVMDTRNTASWKLMESLGLSRIAEVRDADSFKGSRSHEYRYALALQSPP
jgi:ribosomal-protein-alanine N-acetyltransferase